MKKSSAVLLAAALLVAGCNNQQAAVATEPTEFIACGTMEELEQIMKRADERIVFSGIRQAESQGKIVKTVTIITLNSQTQKWSHFEAVGDSKVCFIGIGVKGKISFPLTSM
jgi:uncharacterized lipoprotein YajG